MRKLLAFSILSGLPLLAGNLFVDPVSATHTDRFNLPAAGAIRMDNSFGDIDIEGWDRPEVEVTVVRSTGRLYDAKERAEAQKRLDRVQVTAKQDGNDVVISTVYPPRNMFLYPLSRRGDIDVTYLIKAPRASKLIVDHNHGEVNVSDISGEIHATVVTGQITLSLAGSGHYETDANCKIGAVYSDFEGDDPQRHFIGEELHSQNTAAATKLYLRVRAGDIVILKAHSPSAD
jgi:hypothetical protein